MSGAKKPIVSYPGVHPARPTSALINIRVTIKVYFRPMRSPNRPKNRAPNGRTTNPAANVANVERKDAVGLSAGKNLVERTMERLPKIKKSYHSMSVPREIGRAHV